MNAIESRAHSIFIAVVDRSPDEWAALLSEACGSDASLRGRVDQLLHAHQVIGNINSNPALSPTVDFSPREGPGSSIGPYKLREQIGEGGFGLVFMAEQQHPVRRKVAIKVIKPGMDTQQVIARFEAERQALALMDHPNIARVMDAGETDSGRPYFAMELVRGVPITEYCDEHKLSTRQRLELFVPLCQAVMHAHQRGIIHRDIKPTNVLVTLHDGVPVIKVIDFGIAKALGQQLTDKTLCTGYAQLVGTPIYMSPEQAELSGLDIDTRCDIYSLGVLLYELLTGMTPFDKGRLREVSYDEMRRIIREEEPAKPSTRMSTLGQAGSTLSARRGSDPKRLSQLFRGELDWIVMKALEKDRTRRYETAGSFAADVQRYLREEPVLACPPSTMYRLQKFSRRNRWPLALTAVAAASLLIFAFGSLVWSLYLQAALYDAESNRLRAEGAELTSRQSESAALEAKGIANNSEKGAKLRLFDSLLAQARASRLSHQMGQRVKSLEILEEATRLARTLDILPDRAAKLRNEVIACLALADLRVAKEWDGWPSDSMLIEFDGGLERYARTDRQGIVHIHRVFDGGELWRVTSFGPENFGNATSPYLSHDGHYLLLKRGTRVKLWNLSGQNPVQIPLEQGAWTANAFSPDSRELVLAQADGSIDVFELPSGQKRNRLSGVVSPRFLAYHPKARQVAIDHDTGVRVQDLTTGEVLAELPQSTDQNMVWHPGGKILAIAGKDSLIHLWDVETHKPIARMEGRPHGGRAFSFDHSGELLAGAGWDGFIHLWDTRTGQQLFATQGMSHCIRFSPDDQMLCVGIGTGDNKLRFWEVVRSSVYRTLTDKVNHDSSAFSPKEPLLAMSMADGLTLWDMRKSEILCKIDGVGRSAVFEPSGAMLTSSSSGLLRWPIQRDSVVAGLLRIGPPEKLPLATPDNIAASADARIVASAGTRFTGSQGLVLNRDRPGLPIQLPFHEDPRNIGISPDGQWVATGSHFGTKVKVSSAGDGKEVKVLPVDGSSFVGFSPDGHWLATTGRRCQLWSVPSWTEGRDVGGVSLAFSQNSKLSAVETGYGVIRLVDVNTGREYARLEDPNQQRAYNLCFSPDLTQLVTFTDTDTLRIWDLQAIRTQLAMMNLDWELPPLSPSWAVPDSQPLSVRVDLGNIVGPKVALKRNNEAWKLVASQRKDLRDPQRALALAREAVQLSPDNGHYWNTLGVALYRSGHWEESISALEKSLELMKGQYEGGNCFFLAMSYWQRKDQENARQWYDRGVSWLEKHLPEKKEKQDELRRFKMEAAALLGVETLK